MGGVVGLPIFGNGCSGSEKGWMVREEDDRMGAVVGFVQDHGHRSAGMAAEPDLRAVRALGREIALAQRHASAGASQRPRPLRPAHMLMRPPRKLYLATVL